MKQISPEEVVCLVIQIHQRGGKDIDVSLSNASWSLLKIKAVIMK